MSGSGSNKMLFIWVQYDKIGEFVPHMSFKENEREAADFEIQDLKDQGHRAKYGGDFRDHKAGLAALAGAKKPSWEARPAKDGEDHAHAAFNIFHEGAPASAGRIAHIPASEGKQTRDNAHMMAAAPLGVALAEHLVEYWDGDTPEILEGFNLECDAEILRMALAVLEKARGRA